MQTAPQDLPTTGRRIREAAPSRAAYPVPEAQYLLGGISRAAIYDLINSGTLRSVKIAGRRLVPADAIDDLLAKGEKSAA